MKRVLSMVLMISVLAFMLFGCGNNEPAPAPAPAPQEDADDSSGEEEPKAQEPTTLVISNWGFSEDALMENIFRPFEEAFNAKVVLSTGNNSERLIQVRTNPNHGVDLIYLAQSFSQTGFDEGLFETLDYSRIPNAQYMNEKAAFFVEEGQGPAYTVNRMGIIYNADAIDFEITSFADLWRPELEGKISIPEISTTFGPAVIYIASEKAGVDVKSDNGVAAFEALNELKPNIVSTYSRSSDLVNMMASGEIVAALAADFAVGSVIASTPSVKFIDPIEGAYLNFNTINIVKGSQNIDLAYEFINYLLSEEVQLRAAKNVPDSPINSLVKISPEEGPYLTYGDLITNANTIDFRFVNEHLATWIDLWNRTLNQ